MRKTLHKTVRDGMPLEYPAGFFKGGVRGKYHDEFMRNGGVVRMVSIEPDVARDFPTAKAVNDGLRKFREIQRMMQPAKRRKSA